MGDIKVTEVYGGEGQEILPADHLILSEELKDMLHLPEDTVSEVSPDFHEMSVVVEGDEMINGLVRGNLFSLSSGKYLTVGFNAKSNHRDMLQVLQRATQSATTRVVIEVAGDYGFQATGKNIEKWELSIMDDRSALLTFILETTDVIFR